MTTKELANRIATEGGIIHLLEYDLFFTPGILFFKEGTMYWVNALPESARDFHRINYLKAVVDHDRYIYLYNEDNAMVASVAFFSDSEGVPSLDVYKSDHLLWKEKVKDKEYRDRITLFVNQELGATTDGT